MYVKEYMASPPLTVGAETTIHQARSILQERGFRHLPVVDAAGALLGVVTDRDIRSAYPSTVVPFCADEVKRVDECPVTEIMSADPATLSPGATIDDALLVLDRRKVGAVPVVDEAKKVLGMFSIRDLIQAYKGLFGLGERGSALVEIASDGNPRPLTRIVKALERNDIHFSRVVRRINMAPDNGQDTIYIRVNTFNLHAVHAALKEEGFDAA